MTAILGFSVFINSQTTKTLIDVPKPNFLGIDF